MTADVCNQVLSCEGCHRAYLIPYYQTTLRRSITELFHTLSILPDSAYGTQISALLAHCCGTSHLLTIGIAFEDLDR